MAYYVNSFDGQSWVGCAAHPDGRRGFTVASGASQWTWGHELGHVLGLGHETDTDNLMYIPTASITNPPPDLETRQCNTVTSDADVESCP